MLETERFNTVRALLKQMQANGDSRLEMARFVVTVSQTQLVKSWELNELSRDFDLAVSFKVTDGINGW